jgi:sensor c-di-GMP phosphodiesterase-like protein
VARTKLYRLKSLALLLLTAAIGGAVAFFIARSIILANAKTRLAGYSSDILRQDERLAANINDTLAAANASPYPACSEEDIVLLRQLTFRSPFLKDVGRVSPDYFLCSALAYKMPKPVKLATPDLVTAGGRRIYYNASLDAAKGQTAEIVHLGKSDVVISPNVFGDFDRQPLMFSGGIINRAQHKFLPTYSSAPLKVSYDLMQRTLPFEADGQLDLAQCSRTRPDCVMTAISMRSIWAPNRGVLAGSAAGGAVLGLCFSGLALIMDNRKRNMVNQLRRAVRRKDLKVVYQPIVDIDSGAVVAAEALVRWTDEDDHPIRPDIFIEIAEQHGFIGEITRFVLEQVITEASDIFQQHPGFRISVNMSAMDLADDTFVPLVDSLLGSHAISAKNIGLELTERSTADRNRVVKIIRELRARGHVVYIDDFGTGYSSLAYLHELSVDVLKVDRAFTNTIGTDGVTASIVPQILAMAKALQLKIVVEGVELEQQAQYLGGVEVGIQGQGWLYGKPIPCEVLRERLEAQVPQLV